MIERRNLVGWWETRSPSWQNPGQPEHIVSAEYWQEHELSLRDDAIFDAVMLPEAGIRHARFHPRRHVMKIYSPWQIE